MINRIKIKNLKGIKKGELDLFPLTILLGSNNSGKTTILEALFLASNPFRKVPYFDKGKNLLAVEVLQLMHETLKAEGFAFLLHRYIAQEAEIDCNVNSENYILKFIKAFDKPYIYISSNRKIPKENIDIRGKGIVPSIGHLSLFNNELRAYFDLFLVDKSLLISPNLIKFGYNYLEKNWASIINMGVCRKVAEESSTLSNESYKDITIEPFLGGKLSIYAYLEDGTRIRLGDLGEGIQSYIITRILYEVEGPSIILWDDVESHFNPKILFKISNWFGDLLDEGKQIVLTTHSLEAARIIGEINEEKAGIYLINLDKNILKTKKITLEEIEEFREVGIDVRVADSMLL